MEGVVSKVAPKIRHSPRCCRKVSGSFKERASLLDASMAHAIRGALGKEGAGRFRKMLEGAMADYERCWKAR